MFFCVFAPSPRGLVSRAACCRSPMEAHRLRRSLARAYNPILVDRLRIDRFHLWGRRSAEARSFRPGHSEARQPCPSHKSEARRTTSGHDMHDRHGRSSSYFVLPHQFTLAGRICIIISSPARLRIHLLLSKLVLFSSRPARARSQSSAPTAKAEATGRKGSQRPLGASKYVTCHPPWKEMKQLRRHQEDGISVAQQADLCGDDPDSLIPLG